MLSSEAGRAWLLTQALALGISRHQHCWACSKNTINRRTSRGTSCYYSNIRNRFLLHGRGLRLLPLPPSGFYVSCSLPILVKNQSSSGFTMQKAWRGSRGRRAGQAWASRRHGQDGSPGRQQGPISPGPCLPQAPSSWRQAHIDMPVRRQAPGWAEPRPNPKIKYLDSLWGQAGWPRKAGLNFLLREAD